MAETSPTTPQTTHQLKSRIQEQRTALGEDLDALGDRLSPRRIAQRRTAAMTDTVHSMRDRIMGTASDAQSAAAHAAEDVADRVGEVPQAARRQVEGNPLAAGVLAFAAGLVVAALIPETEREQALAERVQPQVEQVAGEVGRAAQEAAEHLRPAAQEAAEHVRDDARDATQHIREETRSS